MKLLTWVLLQVFLYTSCNILGYGPLLIVLKIFGRLDIGAPSLCCGCQKDCRLSRWNCKVLTFDVQIRYKAYKLRNPLSRIKAGIKPCGDLRVLV